MESFVTGHVSVNLFKVNSDGLNQQNSAATSRTLGHAEIDCNFSTATSRTRTMAEIDCDVSVLAQFRGTDPSLL